MSVRLETRDAEAPPAGGTEGVAEDSFVRHNPQPVLRATPDGLIGFANPASGKLLAAWQRAGANRVPSEYLPSLRRCWATGETGQIECTEGAETYSVSVVPVRAAGWINLYGK